MPTNPFIRPLPKVVSQSTAAPAVSSSSVSQTPKISRGMDGGERAKSIQAIANDIQARTARIEHLRIMSEKMQQAVKSSPQKNSSRIAFLAGQLNQDF